MRRSAVVIGAGHNGLTAACYLAREGWRVTVLEQTEHVGGMTASRELIPEAPGHLVSPCAIDAVYWRASTVEQDLDLATHGLRMLDHDPAWAWLGAEGESLVLRKDIRQTVRDIERFSAVDARTYLDFVEVAMKALAIQDRFGVDNPRRPHARTIVSALRGMTDRRTRRLLVRLLTSCAAEAIEETFVSVQVRGAFASMASILGSLTVDSSGVGLLATAPLHRYGVTRPVGGMQAIPDALAQALLAAGGQIRTAAQVKRIIVESEVVRGVELADGSVVEADVVIAAVPPQVTATMLDPTTSGVAGLRRAPANAAGFGCLTIGVALTGKAELSTHQPARNDGVDLRKPTLFFGTLEQILTAERETRSGQIPSDPPWTATILSATDPTQAPIGQDIVYLYAPTPVRPTSGWSIAREGAVEALVQSVGKYVSGLEERRIGMFAETPADLESRLGAPNGCIYHVDHVLTRLGPLRPAHGWGGNQSPIAGLVLSGAGTHPGGGVSGIPGQLAARAVLAGGQRRG